MFSGINHTVNHTWT